MTFLDTSSAIEILNGNQSLENLIKQFDNFDCLIAAIIITNDYKIIFTDNKKHFERIKQLEVHSF